MDALRRRGVNLRMFESADAADDADGITKALEQLTSPDKLPDQIALDKEMKRHLKAALEDLPTEHRLIVELYFGLENRITEAADPLTLQQIANILGTSPPTVYRRLRDAFRMLKQAMIERGVLAPAPAVDGGPLRRIGNV
jgi:RNA polymerase sigma factor (sigma-70 family)